MHFIFSEGVFVTKRLALEAGKIFTLKVPKKQTTNFVGIV